MADIESLNFEVLLKDDKFKKQIDADLKLARDLNVKLSDILNLKKKLNSETTQQLVNVEKVKQAEAKTAKEVAKAAVQQQKLATETERTKRAAEGVKNAMSSTSSIMRTLSQLTGVTFSVLGIRRFLSSLIEVTGQFEVQKMALRSMLQDIDAADKIYQDLYRFSSSSTYRFSELAKYAKQLAAFNIEKNSLLETTKMLGDVASGVGVSMDRIILAYGHVKSSGFLRGIQLRSFAQNGVPVLEELSKMFSELEGRVVSLGDVFDKMTKREIPFEMVEEAFRRMTSEGGKFYQMQEVLAKTLAGQINILKGRWENLLAAMGENQSGALKGAVQALSNIVSSTENFGKAVKDTMVALGAYEGAMIAISIITNTLTWNTTLLTRALHGIITFVSKNPYVLLAAGVAALGVEIYKTVTAENELNKINQAATRSIDNFNTSMAKEIGELDTLYAKLKFAKEGTDEYNNAKIAIQNRFGSYIQELREEGKEVGDLAVIYDDLATKIREATKARFLETSTQDVTKAYGDVTGKIETAFKLVVGRIEKTLGRSVTALEREGLWQLITVGENSRNSNLLGRVKASLGNSLGASTVNLGRAFGKNEILEIYELSGAEMKGTVDSALKAMAKLWRMASDEYVTSLNDINEAFKQFTAVQDGAAKDAESEIYKISSIVAGIKKIDAELDKLRNKAKSSGGITGAEKQRLSNLTDERKDLTDLYKAIMGVDYDKSTAAGARKAQRDEKAEEKAIAKQAKEAEKAIKQYEDAWLRFSSKAAGAEGTGALYKVTKALGDFKAKMQSVNNEYTKAAELAQKAYGNTARYKEEMKKLAEVWGAQYSDNAADAGNGIAGIAKLIFQEGMAGYDLTDWNDKTIAQIRDIENALDNLTIPADIKEYIKNPILLALLEDSLSKIVQDMKDNTITPEKNKKRAKDIREIAAASREVIDAFREWADAAGEGGLATALDSLSGSINTMLDAASKLATSDYLGAVISIFTSNTNAIIGAFTQIASINRAIAEAKEAARANGFRDNLTNGVNSIFGENPMQAIKNAKANIDALTELVNADKGNVGKGMGFNWWSLLGLLGGPFGAYPTAANIIKSIPNIGSIEKYAGRLGMDVYDQYGNLNADTLRTILDTYDNLTAAEREWMTQAITNSEAYAEAMEQIDSLTKDIFGNIVSSLADKIVDSWYEAGSAALDYSDILNDVAKSYAKIIVQQSLYDAAFNEDTRSRLTDAFSRGDSATAMNIIAEAMDKAVAIAPVVTQSLEALTPYISETTATDTNSLGGGIKGITEETASLLASYINAIRADVSAIRGIQERGFGAIGESMPTLNDYLAQIAANTAQNALETSAILNELRSVIGSEGSSGMVVRVQTS